MKKSDSLVQRRIPQKILAGLVIIVVAFIGLYMTFGTSANTNPFSLGAFSQTSVSVPDCPPGSTCTSFEVSCPGIQQTLGGYLSELPATASTRGVAVFFTGGGGTSWYRTAQTDRLYTNLRSNGLTIYQVSWGNSWLQSANGEDAGPAHLGCRPATVIKWLHDNKYVPLGVSPSKVGQCGFCVTGNSGGSTQSTLAISYFGLESIINAVVPTGGPPHSSIAKGCLAESGYSYGGFGDEKGSANRIDSSYGFGGTPGPCDNQDASFRPRWDQESIAISGKDYNHPTTRVHFIWGDSDTSMQAHGGDYAAKLRAAGSPYVSTQIAAGTPHSTASTTAGADAIQAALLGDTGISTVLPTEGGSNSPPTTSDLPPSSGAGGGDASTAAPADLAGTELDEPKQTTGTHEVVNGLGDIPKALGNLVAHPSNVGVLLKTTLGKLTLGLLLVLLGGAGFALYKKGFFRFLLHVVKR
ncbi:hypothetical protein H0X10_02615 [Candidatus Saccharibacteria bacterium]|nr:hypothetical protein [Candidatus Saccharibacteria bacterium]